MKLTRQEVAQKLIGYLHHRIALSELVDWAESVMMETDFDEANFETLRDTVSRLGLADVKAFGLTWDDCEDILSRLGYRVEVIVSDAEAMASSRE
jgi:hypothetical protein